MCGVYSSLNNVCLCVLAIPFRLSKDGVRRTRHQTRHIDFCFFSLDVHVRFPNGSFPFFRCTFPSILFSLCSCSVSVASPTHFSMENAFFDVDVYTPTRERTSFFFYVDRHRGSSASFLASLFNILYGMRYLTDPIVVEESVMLPESAVISLEIGHSGNVEGSN